MGYGRPDHAPTGPSYGPSELCSRCGLKASLHRARNSDVPSRSRQYVARRNAAYPRPNPSERIIGIDGEGQGRKPHLYTYLAAADERGKRWSVAASRGLSSEQCLDFILDLPRRSLIFGYAFLYDLTKLLQDLPDAALYLLFHEKEREMFYIDDEGKLKSRHRPVRWGPYKLNYMNRRFSVHHIYSNRRVTVWDIFAFFQSKFTKAVVDWQIAAKERLADMERMKDLRASFDQMSADAVHEYCDEECLYLSKLGRQLIQVHRDCGLELKSYYGAGSTASVLLDKMNVLEYRAPPPEEMREALACAFFGGRFENSVVGPVEGPVYNYDISSAYPYQAMLLPCLKCGQWQKTKSESRILDSRLALIHWSTAAIQPSAWGTLPIRSTDGTIAFPLSAKGGWTWKDEYLAARRYNHDVTFTEAWIYNTDCDHRPFQRLGEIYRERVRIGKEARGIVLKLGPNSVYGKVAQSRGGIEPPFQSWIWAGNITSGCRAQLLEAQLSATDPWNVLMYATDGVWSREKLCLPKPIDTGTSDCVKDGKHVPLGGWEEKTFEAGVFAVRPGIYFPLSPTEDQLKEVRARGLGKKVLYAQWPKIIEAWEKGDREVTVGGIERFIGAKTGVSKAGKPGHYKYTRSPYYGELVKHPIKVSFHPAPKRETIFKDGRLVPWHRLGESVPYERALMSPEKLALQLATLIAEEQPNADFSDIDVQEFE